MMQLKSITALSVLSLAMFSQTSLANEPLQIDDRKHSFGLVTGVASGEYKNSRSDGDGFAQAYLFYNYQLFNNFSIELAYTRAKEIDDWDWDCDEVEDDEKWVCTYEDDSDPLFNLPANELEMDGFVFAVKGHLPISQRNSLYAKVGAQYYDYDFGYDDNNIIAAPKGDSGTGLFLEAGWQYRWNCGIGMNVGLRYQDMGDLTFTSPNVGISYAF
ncbi:outer membrane beta-barrel protein [Litorilituus sediminis]|uniref:Porin family protein n=1 Tax=Litorilituus sediminis TaxID=718192 RepID=A0A4P6P4Z6_9GAMM|nr:outer membrane beta-barrel protein [Litorilituus sediminis]QBG36018.1 porin family protein [Litorilituus sediminis]